MKSKRCSAESMELLRVVLKLAGDTALQVTAKRSSSSTMLIEDLTCTAWVYKTRSYVGRLEVAERLLETGYRRALGDIRGEPI